MMFQKGVFLLLLARSVVSFTFTNPQCQVSKSIAFSRNTLPTFTSLYSEISESESPVEEVEEVQASTDVAETTEAFKIYVGNLSYDYEQAQIEELFTPFGIVSECFVPTDKWTGKSRGFAFVTMADKASGEAAVQALDQSQVGDRTIKVNEQLSKEQLQQRPPKKSGRKEIDGTKIYVGNLPFDTEMEMINSMFTQFGTVKDCFLPTDRDTGRPRGFAFVTMEEEEALAAIDALNGSDVGGRSIVVNKSLPRGESAPKRPNRIKLYVGNLSFSTEEDEVLSLFSEYGDVYDCYMPRDRDTGRPRGFAFVTMEEGDALNAEADCNGFEMDGRVLRVNQAQPKGSQNMNDSYNGGGGGGGFYDDSQEDGYYDNGSGSAWEDGY